jgi:hypothetical protein
LPGRTPREAVDAFLTPLKNVVGCVTDEGLVARYPGRGEQWHAVAFQSGFAILDRANGLTLKLALFHRYTVVKEAGDRGPWTVRTAEWKYEVSDQSDEVIVDFHWHPVSGRTQWPHVHAYGDRGSMTMDRLHIPTGRVSIESVIRFLIEDLGVVTRRPDWDRVLTQSEILFLEWRTWHAHSTLAR